MSEQPPTSSSATHIDYGIDYEKLTAELEILWKEYNGDRPALTPSRVFCCDADLFDYLRSTGPSVPPTGIRERIIAEQARNAQPSSMVESNSVSASETEPPPSSSE